MLMMIDNLNKILLSFHKINTVLLQNSSFIILYIWIKDDILMFNVTTRNIVPSSLGLMIRSLNVL
jgi:hypothetical protein